MAKIIAVVNQKGGVGKTTTAVNLGAYLAEFGKYVLLIDLDPQANATSGLGVDYQNLEKGIYEALSGNFLVREIIQPTSHIGYRIAPATPALAGANVELVNIDKREFRLAEALLEVRSDYDVIIIDCPPSLGLLTLNGLVAADHVLIPIQAEYYALEGLGQLMSTIALVQENLKPELSILGAVITMFDKRVRLSDQVFQELYKFFPDKIFRTVVPRNVRLTEAPSHGKSIAHYDAGSKGARAYEKLAREVLEII
ncbi:ParA family protein [Candidatus Falkowbacteria bacterium]|nr:ParA family protein [Candidatus Falkowbacteria bacterium]